MLRNIYQCPVPVQPITNTGPPGLHDNHRPGIEKIQRAGVANLQAVHHSDRKWAEVNPSLWTTVFCNATPQDHCPVCLSLDHTGGNCPDNQQTNEASTSLTKATSNPSPRPICIRYNSTGCSSQSCTFRHVCLECHGYHRRSRCPSSYRNHPYLSYERNRQLPSQDRNRPFDDRSRPSLSDDRKLGGSSDRSFRFHRNDDQAK